MKLGSVTASANKYAEGTDPTATMSLRNAELYLKNDGENSPAFFEVGDTTHAARLTLTNSTIEVQCPDSSEATSMTVGGLGTVAMDLSSRIAVTNFTNNGKITVDAAGAAAINDDTLRNAVVYTNIVAAAGSYGNYVLTNNNDYMLVVDGKNLVTMRKAAWVIAADGTTNIYETLTQAFTNTTDGCELFVLRPVNEDVEVVPTATTFTFKSNGYALTGSVKPADGYKFVKNGDVCEYKAVNNPLLVDYTWHGTNEGAVVTNEYVYGFDAFSSLNEVAQWLWNDKSVLVKGDNGGSCLADTEITLTNGTFGITTTGKASGFNINGLKVKDSTLYVTNVVGNAYKIGVKAGGTGYVADSQIKFVQQDSNDARSYLYAENGGKLTVSNLTQVVTDETNNKWGTVALTAGGSGSEVKILDSNLHIWDLSGVTGGAAMSVSGSSVAATGFEMKDEGSVLNLSGTTWSKSSEPSNAGLFFKVGTGATLNLDDSEFATGAFDNQGTVNVWGVDKFTAAYTGVMNLGRVGETTTLTTDGLCMTGTVKVVDGSTVTLSGNGFDFCTDVEHATLFMDSVCEENSAPHVGYTLNILDADLFRAYGIEAVTGSVVNVSNVGMLDMRYLNVYGSTVNMMATNQAFRAYVGTTANVAGEFNVSNVTVKSNYLKIFGGAEGQQGGSVKAVDAKISEGYTVNVGETINAQWFADGTDATAKLSLAGSSLFFDFSGENACALTVGTGAVGGELSLVGSTVDYARDEYDLNVTIGAKGKVEMDLASSIAASTFANGGTITVNASTAAPVNDTTLANAVAYTNIVASTSGSYGTAGVNYVLTNNNDYMLVVTNNSLVTVRKAAWVISADGTQTNRCDTLAAAFAAATDGCTISVLRDVCEDIAVAPTATYFTFKSNGYNLSGDLPELGKYKFEMVGDECLYGLIVAKVGTETYVSLANALNAAKDADKTCELVTNVTLRSAWTPIADFKGTFDGKGFAIAGLEVSGAGYVGLFKSLNGATVKDVTITGAKITSAGDRAGVLAAEVSSGAITNVKIVDSEIDSSGEYVGALFGIGYSTVTGCELTGNTVMGLEQVGGAIGYMWLGTVEDCSVSNKSVSAGSRAGGLIGKVQFAAGNIGPDPASRMRVNGNTVAGTVTVTNGSAVVGGLAGQIMGDDARYEIRSNTVDVAGVAYPLGQLRNDTLQALALTEAIGTNCTANWWTDRTLDANSYQYTDVRTSEGATVQTVYRGVAGIQENGVCLTNFMTLAAAVAAVTNGQTLAVYADNDENVTTPPAATSFTFDSKGFRLTGGVKAADGYKFVKNGEVCEYKAVNNPVLVNYDWKDAADGDVVTGDYVYGFDAFSCLNIAQWLWNDKTVVVQAGTAEGGGDLNNTITLTNGTFAITTSGIASGFGINGLLVKDGTLSFTNVNAKASKIGALTNGVAEVRDSTVTFAGSDNRIYAEDGGQLTVSNLTQTAGAGNDYGNVKLEAKSGARVNVYDSVLHVGDGSGVTGGATMTLAGSEVYASVFAVSGTGSALNIEGTNKLSAAALTGGFNVGKVGEETLLTTDGLSVTGTVNVVDGSVVTLSGNGFDFSMKPVVGYNSMFQDSADQYNANGHVGYTLNVKDANLFQTYGFYVNTGSVVNVSNVTNLQTWYFNVYGGTMNVTGTDKTTFGASATENFNVTGAMNVRKVAARAATLLVYAGGEGQQGGAFTATDAEVKARFVSLGSEATEAKKYAPGTPAATMAFTNSTLIVNNVDGDNPNTFVIGTNNTVATLILKGSTVDYNHSTTPYASNADMIVGANGKVEMDIMSSIAVSTFTNAGTVTVDGSGVVLTDDNLKNVPESYTLVACAATMTTTNDFGDVTLYNDDYYLAVTNNSLVATRKAAWVISADGSNKTSYVELKDAFANVKSNETISVLHANDETIGTIAATEFTFKSNGYAMKSNAVTCAEGHTFFVDGDGVCRYGRIVATVGDKAYVTLHEALVAAKPAGSVCKLVIDYDISLETDKWEPIMDFYGTFDGQGHKLSGLNIDVSQQYVGLIGDAWQSAVVKNLEIVAPNVSGCENGKWVGVVAGRLAGVVTNVTVTGGTVTGKDQIGGIVGYMYSGRIDGCVVDGTAVSGVQRVGGLVGKLQINDHAYIVGNAVSNVTVEASQYDEDNGGAAALVSQIMTAAPDHWSIADNRIVNVTTKTGTETKFVPIGDFRKDNFRSDALSSIVRNNWQPIVDINNDYQTMINPSGQSQYVNVTNYWVVEAWADGARTNKYLSLEAAAAASEEGWSLKLLEDLDLTSYDVNAFHGYAFATNVTFNLNGHEIVSKNGGVAYEGEGLTISNGTFTVDNGSYALFVGNGGAAWTGVTLADLTCNGGINVYYATVTMRGLTIDAESYYAVWGDAGATITIENGDYVSSGYAVVDADDTPVDDPTDAAHVTILDGAFTLDGESTTILAGSVTAKGGVYNREPNVANVDPEYVAKPQGTTPETWKVAIGVAKIGDVLYHTLADAVTAAEGGETITLTRDSSGDGIVVEKSLTFDFATNTYTVVTNFVGTEDAKDKAFQLNKGHTVVFTNGTIVADNEGLKKIIQNYADLTLADMTLDATKGANSVECVLSSSSGKSTICEGTTIVAKDDGVAFDVYYWPNGGYPDGLTVTVATNVTITGAYEYAHDEKEISQDDFEKYATLVDQSFKLDPLPGYVWTAARKLVKAFAQNVTKDKLYATLADAVKKADPKDVIKVLRSSAGDGIEINKSLTIDFNGCTYTVNDSPVGSKGTESQAFQLLKDNTVTFMNGTITSKAGSGVKMIVQNYANLTLKGMTLDGTNLDDPSDGSGTYTLSTNNGQTILDGSTVISRGKTGDVAFDVCCWSPYTTNAVVVTGGSSITGNVEVTSYNDKKISLDLESGEITGSIVMGTGSGDATVTKDRDNFKATAPLGYVWDKNGVLKPAVWKIGEGEDAVKYATIQEAIDAPAGSEPVTISLMTNAVGPGAVTEAGKNVVIDFAGFTYTVDKSVGSSGTPTGGFQLLAGSTVVMTNGTLTSTTAKNIVQNYADFTAVDMTLVGTNSAACKYVVSNKNGAFTCVGSTSIWANEGEAAFDVCATTNYPGGVTVTIDTTGDIQGLIEYGVWGDIPDDNKAVLNFVNGNVRTFGTNTNWRVDARLTVWAETNLNVFSGGRFNYEVPKAYCAPWHVPAKIAEGVYGVAYAGTILDNLNATTRYPWNGKVDIWFTLRSLVDVRLIVQAFDKDGAAIGVTNVKVAEGGKPGDYNISSGGFPGTASSNNVPYHVIWDSNAEGRAMGVKIEDVSFKVMAK